MNHLLGRRGPGEQVPLAERAPDLPRSACATGLVEVRSRDGDMVDAFALLGEETRVDALLVERLNQLPLHLATVATARRQERSTG